MPHATADDGRREYAEAVEVHQRIEALYARVADTATYFREHRFISPRLAKTVVRSQRVIEADRMLCALANKAATTKRSVFLLCEAGDGRNAMVLARVLLENACLMEWLIRGNDPERLETYVMFLSVLRERGVERLEYFYKRFAGREPRVESDPYHRAVAEHVFRGRHDTWAYFPHRIKPGQLDRLTVRRMFEEVTGNDRPAEYEVWYAMGSDEVHSSPLSVSGIFGRLRERATFSVQACPSDEMCLIALAISNTAMLLVLDALDEFASLGLADEIAAIKVQARSRNKP